MYRKVDLNLVRLLTHNEIYFSKVDNFNDVHEFGVYISFNYAEIDKYINRTPFKMTRGITKDDAKSFLSIAQSQDGIDKLNARVRKRVKNESGVACFTKNKRSPLMYAHYAGAQTGVCLEFDTALDKNFFKDLEKVIYEPTPPNISILDPKLNERYLCTKHDIWSYEEEYRLIADVVDKAKRFNKQALTGIIFAPKSSSDDQSLIRSLTTSRKSPLTFYSAHIDPKSYQYKIIKVV